MSRIFIVEQSALLVGGHYFSYTRTVSRAARELGHDVTILSNRRFAGQWDLPGVVTIPTFVHTWSEAEQLWIRDWRPGNIAFDFTSATKGLDLGEQDHVFFATLGYAELVALLEYFARVPIGQSIPRFHLLLRYDPDLLRHELGNYRGLFEKILRSPKLSRGISFYTDTVPLTKAFSDLTEIEFVTLPIPFDQEPLLRALADRESKKGSGDDALVVTYLGDARLEKRFADLPNAIAAVASDRSLDGRVRFILQANFNVPGGETGMMQAVQRLRQYPAGFVELVEESMSVSDYYRMLADADIVVIPYDPVRYRLRSSGVLIEAMAAGKPVVTSAGSWMAGEVTPDHAVVFEQPEELGDALRSAIERFPALDDAAKSLAGNSMTRSTGRFFVETLLSADGQTASIAHSSLAPRVLVVIDGDTLVLRNGAGQIAATQFRYLRRAGYLVVGLFIMKKKNLDQIGFESWVDALHDRIASLDLENAFIIGTGRMSFDLDFQRLARNMPQHSIAFDLAEAESFDASLALIDFVRTHTIDVVWLNYVTNMPIVDRLGLREAKLVCETHDIQSFQKAIYGGRRVDPVDVQRELQLLRRCDHLISVSNAETAYLAASIDVPTTTAGMFLEPPEDPFVVLAGLKNLGEVVSACQPQTPSLRWDEAWRRNESEQIIHIASLDSLDLLFVSSNHVANVSGLRWFLDTVYFPHLATRGVTLFVAGSISEAATWPKHENIVYLGRVAHLDPLYAATKLVIIPITEGAGIAVKTFEALNYGVPVVATPTAVRGSDHPLAGVEVTATSKGFAAAVVRLLSSRITRKSMGRAAAACARQQFGSNRYAELIDPVMKSLLGERALSVPRSERASDSGGFCEWDDTLVFVHRLVRSWIEDDVPEIGSIIKLADMPRDKVMKVLATSVAALLSDRSAYLFKDRSSVMSVASRLSDGEAEAALAVLTDLVDGFAYRPAAGHGVVIGQTPECWICHVGGSGTVRINGTSRALSERPGYPTVRQITLPDQGLQQPRMQSIRLDAKQHDAGLWCVSHRIVLWAAASSPGSDDERAYAEVRVDGTGGHAWLTLPTLYARSPSARWLDFVVGGELPISLTDQSGLMFKTSAIVDVDGMIIQRFVLPPGEHRALSIRVDVSPAAYLELADILIFHRVLFGELELADDPGFAGAVKADLKATLARRDLLPSIPTADEMLVRGLMSSAVKGTAMSRSNALTFLARLDEDRDLGRKEMLRQILEDDIHDAHSDFDTFGQLLGVQEAFGPGHSFVASFALDLCLESAVDPVDLDICPSLDGREMVYAEVTATGTLWRESRAAEGGRNWLRHVTMSGRDTASRPLYLVLRFTADGEGSGQNRLTFDQVHQLEADDIASWVWTNGSGSSVMTIPAVLSSPGTIRLSIDNVGLNDPAVDITIELNSTTLPHTVAAKDRGYILSADFSADEHKVAAAEVRVSARHLMKPLPDTRTLGVSISALELKMLI